MFDHLIGEALTRLSPSTAKDPQRERRGPVLLRRRDVVHLLARAHVVDRNSLTSELLSDRCPLINVNQRSVIYGQNYVLLGLTTLPLEISRMGPFPDATVPLAVGRPAKNVPLVCFVPRKSFLSNYPFFSIELVIAEPLSRHWMTNCSYRIRRSHCHQTRPA